MTRADQKPPAPRPPPRSSRRCSQTHAGLDLPVRLRAWDGSEAGPRGTPVAVIRSPEALCRLLWRPGELGLARAYVSGELDVEGDLTEGLRLVFTAIRPKGTPKAPPAWTPAALAPAAQAVVRKAAAARTAAASTPGRVGRGPRRAAAEGPRRSAAPARLRAAG